MALELREADGRRRIQRTVTLLRTPAECYALWRDFALLPSFMHALESVTVGPSGRRSHWVAKATAGDVLEWDAEVIEDIPDEFISWRSLPGPGGALAGEVAFHEAPAGGGTEMTAVRTYDPPAGEAGTVIARLFGADPAQQLDEDVRRFKALMETGRTPTTEGQSHGRNRPSAAKRGAA